MGGLVFPGLDATQMRDHHFLTTQRFDCIVYNFPHFGFRFPEGNGCQIKPLTHTQHESQEFKHSFVHMVVQLLFHNELCFHQTNKDLVKGFMRNAKALLKKDTGEIHVTHKDGDPYDKWDLVKKAQKRAHSRLSNDPFALGDCTTYKFRLP